MPVRLVPDERLPPPLEGYRLIERLGRGGFGEVWKVEAPGGLLKAMKFVFGDLDAAEEEGRPADQELKALHRVKAIRHPYILSLERFDIIDGQLIIVMELADRNLWDRYRECRTRGLPGVPRDELLGYMAEAAEALDLMNNQYQIQHLDVKPQNLFLMYSHVKVADFGLAKVFEGARGTVTGGVTPVYAAPETFEGWISRFTDQYSLAIVFQELLTGTRPFNGVSTKQLLLQHLNGVPDTTALAPADRAAVERGLSKRPEDRWPSCSDMIRALRDAGTASPPNITPPPARPADSGTRVDYGVAPLSPITSPTAGYRPPPRLTPPPTSVFPGLVTPALVTPRLVTPQGAAGSGGGPPVTIQRPQVFQTARMTSVGIAPPERTGSGVLFPALVVGVGQTGLAVLRALRQMVREQFSGPDPLPHLRFLYVDTDPDATAAAVDGPDALSPREVVLARLNRPGHYLQRDGLPPVEQWLPPGLLYRLPRNPGPAAGVRAFGRLALCDNYRLIAQRVRQQTEAFLSDDPLDRAAEATRLGVRTNRARAYVVAGLAGGTGAGMVIDLAYLVKHEFRQIGYRQPEAVGLLAVPPADRAAARPAALANAYATLAEVAHFAAGTRYQTRFDTAEPPLIDSDGPFARLAVVTLPKSGKERDRTRVVGLAARGLFAELLTPVGRVADAIRQAAKADAAGVPAAAVFGLYRLSWPRPELLAAAARRFCQRLLGRWAAKDAGHLKEPIAHWLEGQWAKQKLDPGSVAARFDQAVKDALGESADAVFDQAIDSLRTLTPGAGRFDAGAAADVLDGLLKLVGKPGAEADHPGSLAAVIADANKKLAAEAEASLAAVAVSFVEQPQYRLAGAEEALNQMGDRLRETVTELEDGRAAFAKEAADLYPRLIHLIGTLAGLGPGGRRAAMAAELFDLMREFPAKRLRATQAAAALTLYRGLLGNVPEYLREVNFCRTRLGELGQALNAPAGSASAPGPGALILPDGCDNLDGGADQFLSAIPADDILQFDQSLQAEVKRRFRGVVNVCLKPDRAPDFLALLAAEARAFLDVRLEHADPAAVFLRHRGADAGIALARAFADAAPDIAFVGDPPAELAILATPPGPAGDMVREHAAAACPDVPFVPAVTPEDILFYREYPQVPLADLPSAGPEGREAYLGQLGTDHPPHARADVHWPAIANVPRP